MDLIAIIIIVVDATGEYNKNLYLYVCSEEWRGMQLVEFFSVIFISPRRAWFFCRTSTTVSVLESLKKIINRNDDVDGFPMFRWA